MPNIARFFALVFAVCASNPAHAATYCGNAFLAQAQLYDAGPLLRHLEATPSSYVGALQLSKQSASHTVVFVSGSLPSEVTKGLRPAGDGPRRLLASRSMIPSQSTLSTERALRVAGWTSWLAGGALLVHELVNPGVLPNNLPTIPVILGSFLWSPVVGNALALYRRFIASPPSPAELVERLAGYLENQKGEPGAKLLHVVALPHYTAVSPRETAIVLAGVEAKLADLGNTTQRLTIDGLRNELQGEE